MKYQKASSIFFLGAYSGEILFTTLHPLKPPPFVLMRLRKKTATPRGIPVAVVLQRFTVSGKSYHTKTPATINPYCQ
jgi:hypothetical protein